MPLGEPLELPLPTEPEPGEIGVDEAGGPELALPVPAEVPELGAARVAPDLVPAGLLRPAAPQSALAEGVLGPDSVPLLPVLPPALFSLRATAGGQSTVAPEADELGVREPPLESGMPGGAPPAPGEPVEPLAPELGRVFGSTGLPVPSVLELTPAPPVEGDWATAIPAADRSAASSMVDERIFIFPP